MSKLKKKLTKLIGPGFITGASDDDPAGIITYTQAGVVAPRFGLLWTAFVTFPLMTAVQEIAGRIGLVTGKGLGQVIGERYSKPMLYLVVAVLFAANTVTIGADIGAMSTAVQILLPVVPQGLALVAITGLSIYLAIFVSYKAYGRILKWLGLSLLAYILAVLISGVDWKLILTNIFVPHIEFTAEFFYTLVAVLGTTISPYLFFWEASEEVEEERMLHLLRKSKPPKISKQNIREMREDTAIGMGVSNLVMFFVMAASATFVFPQGIRFIDNADQAISALSSLGAYAPYLFALGILGTGLLALPVLAGSAAYALSEALNWKEGLYRKFNDARGFYGLIAISMILGLVINFFGFNVFRMLVLSAVINGLAAPLIIFLMLRIASDSKIMGKYVSSTFINVLGFLAAAVMTAAGAFLLFNLGDL